MIICSAQCPLHLHTQAWNAVNHQSINSVVSQPCGHMALALHAFQHVPCKGMLPVVSTAACHFARHTFITWLTESADVQGTKSSKKKKQAKLKRVMATVKKQAKKADANPHDSFAAVQLLNDPQVC